MTYTKDTILVTRLQDGWYKVIGNARDGLKLTKEIIFAPGPLTCESDFSVNWNSRGVYAGNLNNKS